MVAVENNSSEAHASNLEESQRSWLTDNPLISSILIAVLVGVFLQMTWIIGVQELASAFTTDILTILLADFGFRMTMGLILIFLIITLMFGYHRKDSPLREYGDHMRVNKNIGITKTVSMGVLPVLGFILLMLIISLLLGVFNPDPTVLIADYKWFVFFLALVPGIWEELAFRGVILSNLQQKYSPKMSVLISAVLFGLFHLSNLVKDDLTTVLIFTIMATGFGIGWGYIVVKSNSVLPAVFIHYAVDVVLTGPLFVDVGLTTDTTAFLLSIGLTILFPIVCVILARMVLRNETSK